MLEGVSELEVLTNESAVKKLEIERQYQELLEKAKSNEEINVLNKAKANELKASELELEQAIQGLRENALENIDEEIAKLEAKIAGKEEEYEIQKKINDLVAAGGGAVSQQEAADRVNRLEQLKQEAAAYDELKGQVEGIAGSISGAFTDAFRSIIDGSKSAEEALSDAFMKIGEAFLDMAMQIIQEQLKMIIYGMIMKALGVSMPGAGGFGSGAQSPLTNTSTFAGAFNSSGFGVTAFPGMANGGTMLAGQPTLVGERGPELVTPTQTMNVRSRETMGSYMPSNSMQQSVSTAPINMNYNGPTLTFNAEEYIPRSEAPRLVAEGAKMGEMRTMASLKNNRSSRSRIGL